MNCKTTLTTDYTITTGATTCINCATGYVLTTNAKTCVSTTGYKGVESANQAGYVIGASGITCAKDNSGTPTACLASDSATATLVGCSDNYYIDGSAACAPCSALSTGCITCTLAGVCSTCDTNAGYNSAVDSTSKLCVACTGGSCTKCPATYVLTSGACAVHADATTVTNCKTWVNACTACKDGYYLDASTPAKCVPCPTGCNTCSSATVCLTCVDSNSGNNILNATTKLCVADTNC